MQRGLIRAQAISGLVLALFITLHGINLAAANLGPAAYDRVQRIFRVVYQQPLFEIVAVLGALLIHAAVGLIRARQRAQRRKQLDQTRPTRSWRLRLHRASAYYLVFFVFGHMAATRLPSLIYGVWPEAAGVGFAMWWVPAFFYPYYFLLALCGLYHGVVGIAVAARVVGWRVPKLTHTQLAWISGIGALTILGALLALAGVTQTVPDPTDNDYARFYEAHFGVELSPPG